ncbi:MAG: polysaccharide deacetylase family protein [Oscillospiraceae bacterium]|nr:polysaccharide deacetylase family protein [Oscillospiraceae bacterium]
MKNRMVRIVCLLLAAVMMLPASPVMAAEQDTAVILQLGSEILLHGREESAIAAPYYAPNGAVMVPLAPVCEALGASVQVDAGSGRATVQGNSSLIFTAGHWSYFSGGTAQTLASPPVLAGNTFFVPVQALRSLAGVYVHTFGYYDGGFLVLSAAPLTEGDLAGAPNENFSSSAPDAALLQARKRALQTFGPNRGLFDRSAILLRQDSCSAWVAGKEVQISPPGSSYAPYQSPDGLVMLPLRFLTQALGGSYQMWDDGTAVVTYGGHIAAFPAESGSITVDGVKTEHADFGSARKDGEAFCSLAAFTAALDLYGATDSAANGIVISPYSLAKSPALQAAAWSRVQALPRNAAGVAKGYLALTFDDGPSGKYTTALLDGLQQRGAHATFFLCNYRIASYPDLMGRYLAEGHEVGNHSATHAQLTKLGAPALAAELDNTNKAICAGTGTSPVLMRPPGGAYHSAVLQALQARGMDCILWSVDTQDWKYHNTQTVTDNILSVVRDGDIILMHDMYPTSVQAALRAIDTLQAQGYVFVTVSELARIKGVSLQSGQVYHSFR